MARYDGIDLLPEKRQRLLDLQPDLREEYTAEMPDVLLFRCRDCGTIYPLNHFARNDQRLYGIRPTCRQCRRAQRPGPGPLPSGEQHEKFCSGCRVAHPVQAFHVDRSQPDGYSRTCREYARKRRREVVEARRQEVVDQARREGTVRLCGQLGIAHPGHDIKQCRRCGAVRHINEFGNDWRYADRKRSTCLDCRSQQSEGG